jgi:diaminohydroxyphosphoribosylaminopyrimidine deaminase/5-amino-6-(5-phosphoribosylamino)uracil reductase
MTSRPLDDNTWMRRCFDLAKQGLGYVSPNPPVGAVMVHHNRIIGEGFHTRFGYPHAEVEAINSVQQADRHLIHASTLYVSLEPCCITGKTPPCTSLIIREGIKDVRISTRDPNPAMAGSGIELLKAEGIQITEAILEEEGKSLISAFTTNILLHRPHIILKWAQSKFGYLGMKNEQIWLSDPLTKIWSHGQRAKVDAVMVGARTVETDNPSLTTREYPGRSPHRIVFDPNGRLNNAFNVFADDGQDVYYFSSSSNDHLTGSHIRKYLLSDDNNTIHQILNVLYSNKIGIVLVEGGAYLQQRFIDANLWDEAWVIQTQHPLSKGIIAPNVKGRLIEKDNVGQDRIVGIKRQVQYVQ